MTVNTDIQLLSCLDSQCHNGEKAHTRNRGFADIIYLLLTTRSMTLDQKHQTARKGSGWSKLRTLVDGPLTSGQLLDHF